MIEKNIKIAATRDYFDYLLGDKECLAKAYNIVNKAYSENPASVELFLYTVFFNVEMQNTDVASKMLDSFRPYVNYYKNFDVTTYAKYLFLIAFLDQKNMKRSISAITDLDEALPNRLYDELRCYMLMRDGNLTDAYVYLERAYKKNSRSPFIFLCLYDIFRRGNIVHNPDMILDFFKWAKNSEILSKYPLNKNSALVKDLLRENLALFKDLYKKIESKPEWMLLEICRILEANKDYGWQAYGFYKELEQKQIYTPEFNRALILSAYHNQIEDISKYSMELYVKSYNIDLELTPFVYHLLLTNDKLTSIITSCRLERDIIALSAFGAKKNIKTRHFNSMYMFAIEKGYDMDYKDIMATYLYEDLFSYKITVQSKDANYVWISENEKKSPKIYKLVNGKCMAKLTSENFRLMVLDDTKKEIIHDNYVLERQVESPSLWIYKYFYNQKHQELDLCIALCLASIKEKTILDEDLIDICTKTLNFKEISQNFKNAVSDLLGKALFLQGRNDKVLEYYQGVDINALNPRYINTMVEVFMEAEDYAKVFRLITQKPEYVEDKTLFIALKTLAQEEKYKNHLVNLMYEILAKGYYDKMLLDIVLEDYNGSQYEWQLLSDSLEKIDTRNQTLDEIIIESAIWTRTLNKSVQKVFLRLQEKAETSQVIGKFIYYLCYEIIKNSNNNIEPKMLNVLEIIYQKTKDTTLLLAISSLYIQKNIITIDSEQIIKESITYQEKNEIMLQPFMNLPEKFLTSYMEKNISVVHNSTAGKEIFLYYKSSQDKGFTRTPMKYFKFGIYIVNIPVFYGETIMYYFNEIENADTINNEKTTLKPTSVQEDEFFIINNALIYYEMLKYDEVEHIIPLLFITPEEPRLNIL